MDEDFTSGSATMNITVNRGTLRFNLSSTGHTYLPNVILETSTGYDDFMDWENPTRYILRGAKDALNNVCNNSVI